MPDYKDCLKHFRSNSTDSNNWGNYYFSYDVSYTFNDLYTNRYGLRDKFKNYWIQVARTFAGNQYVLGYEIINEPFAGSLYKNPLVMIPSMA
jgi:endoglycosylceramidase